MMASIFSDVGGVKTLVLIALAVVVAVYLWSLSRREKKTGEADTALSVESLSALPDDEVVDAVVKNLLASCDKARPDPYRMTAVWANAQVNVYSVWVTVKELENGDFATLCKSASGKFLPLAAEGFAQIGASRCEAVTRALLAAEQPDEAAQTEFDRTFAEAVQDEQPLNLCVPYIRDNAEQFVNGQEKDGE